MSWLDKLLPPQISFTRKKKSVPEGVWAKCIQCGEVVYTEEHVKNLRVCNACGYHERIAPALRLEFMLDDPEMSPEIGAKVRSVDFLGFSDTKPYSERLSALRAEDSFREALVVRKGKVDGHPAVVAAFDFSFLGGSMGSVVGERFVLGVEEALAHRCPFICFSSSGGARMQEGLTSLLQMGKVCAAARRLGAEGLPYVSVLTDPTTGGVAASLSMVGDVVIAEPRALVGFAGPRVIQETVREILPEGFQSSEFLLDHGAVDMIVDRRKLRATLSSLLAILTHAKQIA